MVMSIPTTAIVEPGSPAHHPARGTPAHRLSARRARGLACLAFVGSDFLLWLALIPPGIWLCSQIQTGTTGVSYVGTQAMFAYLMSMVQGQGPPDSISPGLERLVGVMGGLSVLFVVTLILSLIPLSPPVAGARRAAIDKPRSGDGVIRLAGFARTGGSFGQVQDRDAGRRQLYRSRRRLRLRDGGADADRRRDLRDPARDPRTSSSPPRATPTRSTPRGGGSPRR